MLKSPVAGQGLMDSFNKRPTYYIYQLYNQYGNHLLPTNSDTPYVSVFTSKKDDGSETVMLVNLNDTEGKKGLQLNGGDKLIIKEAYLFDSSHKAEATTPPEFTNSADVTLPADSVMLFIFK